VRGKESSTLDCYDEHFNIYDEYQFAVVPHYRDMLDIVAKTCQRYLTPNSSIIDLGCGTGNTSLAILQKMPIKIYLLDGSPGMIRIAYDKIFSAHPGAIIGSKITDLAAESWADGLGSGYDAVVSTLVLEHLSSESYENVLKDCFGLLKPGGKLIVVEGYDETGSDMIQWFNEEMEFGKNKLDSELSEFVARLRSEKEIHYYTSKRQKEMWWKEAGFGCVNILWQYLCIALMVAEKPLCQEIDRSFTCVSL